LEKLLGFFLVVDVDFFWHQIRRGMVFGVFFLVWVVVLVCLVVIVERFYVGCGWLATGCGI
jgi:hypothetical protein